MSSPSHSRAARCRGAALVELTVLLLVMIPLLVAVPAIGKLVDLRQRSVLASRYAIWEATVASPGDDRPAALKSRFFDRGDQPLASQPSSDAEHALWGDVARTGDGPLADTDIRIDAESVAAGPWQGGVGDLEMAGSIGSAIASAGQMLGGSDWDIGKTALTRADIAVNVRSNAWFDALTIECGDAGGCVRESGVLLVDGWSAGDDEQARERVRALVPAARLEQVGDLLSQLGRLPILRELRDMDGMFGHVDMAPLPAYADPGLDTYGEP